MVQIKRVYEEPERADGYRVLIDRLWPRGIKKTSLRMDEWAKELAPSKELRRQFGHDPAHWRAFRNRYKQELNRETDKVKSLAQRARKGTVTLLYSAKDTEHNNAIVLKDILENQGSGGSNLAVGR